MRDASKRAPKGAPLLAVPTLKVLVDGAPLPEAEARAVWERFSAHMEANRGDLAGFAAAEGWASVHPAMGPDGAELHASRSAAQRPYQNVARDEEGSKPGSPGVHGGAAGSRKSRGRRRR